jgi:ClpX C4-type zinc finger
MSGMPDKVEFRPSDLRCSFCDKSQKEEPRLVAGSGGVAICIACVGLAASALGGQRSTDASAPKGHDLNKLSEQQLLDGLRRRSQGIRQVDDEVREVVSILRDRQVAWARIGEALGISRQSAWERFSNEA